jgi:hypothetical protein
MRLHMMGSMAPLLAAIDAHMVAFSTSLLSCVLTGAGHLGVRPLFLPRLEQRLCPRSLTWLGPLLHLNPLPFYVLPPCAALAVS